jgi:hypothetical protein
MGMATNAELLAGARERGATTKIQRFYLLFCKFLSNLAKFLFISNIGDKKDKPSGNCERFVVDDAWNERAAAAIILGETPQISRSTNCGDPSTPANLYSDAEKFWGLCPGEDVWPIFSAAGYFDPRTLKRVDGMKKLT